MLGRYHFALYLLGKICDIWLAMPQTGKFKKLLVLSLCLLVNGLARAVLRLQNPVWEDVTSLHKFFTKIGDIWPAITQIVFLVWGGVWNFGIPKSYLGKLSFSFIDS